MEKYYYYYCSEDISLIENYEKAKADNFKSWCIHHRLETHNFDGTRRKRNLSKEDLLALDMYVCRPASELIFMRIEEHVSLHHKGKTVSNSEETKRKISEARKGKTSPRKGIKLTDGQKLKMSEAHKGKHHSEETRRKMSKTHKGENSPWYGKHFSDEMKKKLSESHKGKHWKLVDGKRVWY